MSRATNCSREFEAFLVDGALSWRLLTHVMDIWNSIETLFFFENWGGDLELTITSKTGVVLSNVFKRQHYSQPNQGCGERLNNISTRKNAPENRLGKYTRDIFNTFVLVSENVHKNCSLKYERGSSLTEFYCNKRTETLFLVTLVHEPFECKNIAYENVWMRRNSTNISAFISSVTHPEKILKIRWFALLSTLCSFHSKFW